MYIKQNKIIQLEPKLLYYIKSQCMVFKPNRFKLYCPAVYLNRNIIDYVEEAKYLGYMFTNDKQDEV